jgi:hypothetical protein
MNELNIKSSTVEKGLDLAKELMSKLLGPAINEIGEYGQIRSKYGD